MSNSALAIPKIVNSSSIQMDTSAYLAKEKELTVQVLEQEAPSEPAKVQPPRKTLELIKKITNQANDEEEALKKRQEQEDRLK